MYSVVSALTPGSHSFLVHRSSLLRCRRQKKEKEEKKEQKSKRGRLGLVTNLPESLRHWPDEFGTLARFLVTFTFSILPAPTYLSRYLGTQISMEKDKDLGHDPWSRAPTHSVIVFASVVHNLIITRVYGVHILGKYNRWNMDLYTFFCTSGSSVRYLHVQKGPCTRSVTRRFVVWCSVLSYPR